MVNMPPKAKYRSCFRNFFVSQDGVISLSLKSLTLVGSISITVALLTMLFLACKNGQVKCDWRYHSPMVSDVICLPMMDRVWCILTTFFSLSVMQVNIRAEYKRLHGIASSKQNDHLIWIGAVTCISFPLIGYFDEHNYSTIHGLVSGTFFLATAAYGHKLSNQLWKHRAHFS
jgi:hypothetical protein